ncbi:hypothetical protein MKX01_037404 [Papaver californicum]|nr:hypothetical protein MKX01_037404 [Papaver californicum]
MLEDDVASNKAIGYHGASLIPAWLTDSKKISVLTHCNTGSLATAGYGAALGVIRLLYAEGISEHAYCTETWPFNQHGVPFYVAAPLTSIDLSLSSGDKIVIEERSANELLNTKGGLGEQVAASGISVWNPAFDVTPATIIDSTITEA